MATPAATLCRVCRQRAAEYTCPRCNARYCSLDCYKLHSERCTEGFYRDAAVSELRNTSAGEDERQRMLEILQRLHQQELEEGGSGGSDGGEEGGDSSGDDEAEGSGLSSKTLHRLIGKMQAMGGALEVSPDDLTPAELAAFHRALAAGELIGAVDPWEPWWLSEEAARLELSTAGTALVVVAAAGEAEGQSQEGQAGAADSGSGSREEPASMGAAGGAAAGSPLPPPPSRPLPPLSALTRAAPSPLLRWQLLDLLYSYCFTLRRYNGDYELEAADAADALFALSSVLAAVAHSGAGGGGGSAGEASSSGGSGDAMGAAPALLACVQRACQPPVGGRDGRGFAVGVMSDVAAVLQLGRPAVLTALMDVSRLVEAARRQLEGGGTGGGEDAVGSSSSSSRTKQQQKELKRRLVAAERKLLFFLAWANEQAADELELLAMAAAAEHQKHAAAVGGQTAAAVGGGLEARLATAGHVPAVKPQYWGPTYAEPVHAMHGATLIQEL